MRRWRRWLAGLFLLAVVLAAVLFEPDLRRLGPSREPGAYDHDRFGTRPAEHLRRFSAFVVSFDGDDDDTGDGIPDTLAVPQWVAYELRRQEGPLRPGKRPSRWDTDPELFALGLAPDDDSYQHSSAFRARHPDWYVRGHLAMKYHAERLGPEAGRQTHTLLNAVPQRAGFNSGIWLDLECLTGAWADQYGRVWIITGPVFRNRIPRAWLGDPAAGERRVAIPDALFKVVVRETGDPDRPAILGLVYPQEDPAYSTRPYPHARFLASVDEVEAMTGLDLLADLPKAAQKQLEAVKPTTLWPRSPGGTDGNCGNP
jgi:DNA/RNA endonuclease G (NUC1)